MISIATTKKQKISIKQEPIDSEQEIVPETPQKRAKVSSITSFKSEPNEDGKADVDEKGDDDEDGGDDDEKEVKEEEAKICIICGSRRLGVVFYGLCCQLHPSPMHKKHRGEPIKCVKCKCAIIALATEHENFRDPLVMKKLTTTWKRIATRRASLLAKGKKKTDSLIPQSQLPPHLRVKTLVQLKFDVT